MKKTRTTQENRTGTTSSARVGTRITETSPEPKTEQLSATENANPQRPIQSIAERFPASEEQQVTLTFFDPKAKVVCVAGSFNDWRPDATPLKNAGFGEWAVILMLKSGQYEYRFVVDGRWRDDPRTHQRVTNPHGGFNSVLTVSLADRTFFL